MAGPVLGLLVVLGLAACGRNEAAEPPVDGTERTVAVRTATVVEGPVVRRTSVSGQVRPIRRVFVNSQMSAEVRAVRVEEGDRVRAGDLMIRLDDRDARADLAAAEARYEVAKTAYERAEALVEADIITEADFEQERTAYASAESELERARTRMSYTEVRAPVSGTVTEKTVEMGTVVGVQDRLFAIDDLSTLVVRTRISELDVVHLEVGERVEVQLDAFPGRRLEGRIRRIFPAADAETRLVPVEVQLVDADPSEVRPGFLARVSFELRMRRSAPLVPAGAVTGPETGQMVFVVEDGRAGRREIETGLESDGWLEVVDGLRPGEEVVVAGLQGLREGDRVRRSGSRGGDEAGREGPEGREAVRPERAEPEGGG